MICLQWDKVDLLLLIPFVLFLQDILVVIGTFQSYQGKNISAPFQYLHVFFHVIWCAVTLIFQGNHKPLRDDGG